MPRSVEISLFELHLLLTKQSWQISIVTLKGIKSHLSELYTEEGLKIYSLE